MRTEVTSKENHLGRYVRIFTPNYQSLTTRSPPPQKINPKTSFYLKWQKGSRKLCTNIISNLKFIC